MSLKNEETTPITKLRQAREKRKWSRDELIERFDNKVAELADSEEESETFRRWCRKQKGLNLRTLVAWENAERLPSMPYQKVLCEVFGLSSEELGFTAGLEKSQGVEPDAMIPLEDQEITLLTQQPLSDQEARGLLNQVSVRYAEVIQPLSQEEAPQVSAFRWQSPTSLFGYELPEGDTTSGLTIEDQRKKRQRKISLRIGALAGLALLLIVGIVIFSLQALPKSPHVPYGASIPGATSTSGHTIQFCYDQKQHIGPITVFSTILRLSTIYVVDPKSLCLDINFKPFKQNEQIEVRVVFLDTKTSDVKGYGQWKPLSTSTWIVLATGIQRGTHYTLEFINRSLESETIVEGDLAA